MKSRTKIIIPINTMTKPIDDPRILRGMERQLQLRQDRLNSGEKSIGWKLGFGAPASLERFHLAAPLVGFLTDKTLLPSKASVSTAGWTKPALEPEIAVYMGMDLTGIPDREETRAAIASLGPAIELADVNFPPDEVGDILAGNIYNRHVILGNVDSSRAGFDLSGLTGRVHHNGQDMPPVTNLQALTGDIVETICHTAGLLSTLGVPLRAGDVIITGSIVPPLQAIPDSELRYVLDPIDTISIRTAG